MALRTALLLAATLAGCTGSPTPLAPPESVDLDAPASPTAFCGTVDWTLDVPTLVAGQEARLVLHLANPCPGRIEVATSTRQPTMWSQDAQGNVSIFRSDFVRSTFFSMQPGETKDWSYTWMPRVAGAVTLKVDYPEFFREYQALRYRAFHLQVG
jgi:hypothetical protein